MKDMRSTQLKLQRTDYIMAKRKTTKDRLYNGQKKNYKGQTTQWPKEK